MKRIGEDERKVSKIVTINCVAIAQLRYESRLNKKSR